ncbi:Palmitoyltransferase SWF1 [Neonectria ditissima]|uniref:Palmitoyltransferase n=1 Tax=Neonectria ditissima TaxID=78410 RepID=A0A0P7BA20_9HYPO|nr:Palmitoyltransferase SWF1 [Neonectria ditissima]
MFSFRTIVLSILFLSFMVFVAFFGRLPALRRTPIAKLHKLIWVQVPNAVLAVDQALTGGRVSIHMARFGRYMIYDRHWTIVGFFFMILAVAEYMYLPQVWPQIGSFTKLTVAIAVVMPYTFLYLACASDPGYITPENLQYHLALYPYDHTLFRPGRECRTCRLLKPARSKHCSICKRCVAKSDHHCIFINSCVGYGNQHWFLLLLASTALVCTYGGLLGLSILTARIYRMAPNWSMWPPKGMSMNQYMGAWGWGIQEDVNVGATTLLALLTSPLVWGLLIYTLYLVYCGTTTNETLKWAEWKDDMQEGYAFRRSMPPNWPKNAQVEPVCRRWPVETEQVLITTMDGEPPREDGRLPGEGPWERVWSLKHVENLYDLGFWDNLVDAFVPDYTFGNGVDDPVIERRRRTR